MPTYASPIGTRADQSEAWKPNESGLRDAASGDPSIRNHPDATDGKLYLWTPLTDNYTSEAVFNPANWERLGAAATGAASGASTDFVNVANYTGGADNATTQGIYRRTNGVLGGAPATNFVWTLDVDVFGDHIKQTFSPRDTGTTVLGYWVRRSFNGGATWSAWAGR